MAVNSTNSLIQYPTVNGATTAFPFPYLFLNNSHLIVLGVDALGNTTTYVMGTHYTVTGAGNIAGGMVTFAIAPAAGTSLTIYRDIPLTQGSDYVNDAALDAEVIEADFDMSVMRDQQLKDSISRAIVAPKTDPASISLVLPSATARANKVLGFDPDGNVSVLTSETENVALAQAAADSAHASALLSATSAASIKPYDENQYASAAGTNAYTAALTPSLTAYVTGMELALLVANANTGASTLAVDGLPAKSIQNKGAALAAGDIAAGQTIKLRYDGVAFQLLNPSVSALSTVSVPVRQTVLSGPVDANGLPSILPATSASLTLTTQNISALTPLILAAAGGFGASGVIDRIAKLIANISWNLPPNSVPYFGFDIAADGTVTPVVTTLAPLYVNMSASDYYSADITATGYAISGGDTGGYPASQAFNNSAADTWASSQAGTGISGVAYIGQDFGGTKRVRKITLNQGLGSTANCITSALVQYSDNGTTWTTVSTISPLAVDNSVQTFLIPDGGAHRFWRLLANANPSGGSASWQVREIEMMEFSSAVNGQFVFSIPNMIGTVGDGANANAVCRVFIGEAVTGASTVTSTVAYAYQGKFQTIFPSPAASTNTTYSHNIGMKPLHVRTFMICTIVEAGWAVGDEVDIQGASFASGYVVSGNPVSCIGNNTARYTQGDINPRLPSISSPGTYINSTRANWSVKSILQRGW